MKTFLLIIAVLLLVLMSNQLEHIHTDIHNYLGAPLH